jgi:hypothetical protein
VVQVGLADPSGSGWRGKGRHPATFTAPAPEWTLDAAAWFAALVGDAGRHTGVRTTVLASVAPA